MSHKLNGKHEKKKGEARFKRRATAALSTIDRIKIARRLKQGRASVLRLPCNTIRGVAPFTQIRRCVPEQLEDFLLYLKGTCSVVT